MESSSTTEKEVDASSSSKAGFKVRDGFSTRLGVLLATLGSAVGLGNIWKFPTLTGSSGGAVFIIIYMISVLLIGIPVLVSEHAIGRTARANAVDSMKKVSPNKVPWWLIGALGIVSAFFIMAFYSEVAGWVLAYILKAFSSSILSTDSAVTTQAFTSLVSNPGLSILWQAIDLLIVGGILMFGVSKGIERVTKKLLPLLAILLVVVAVRSVTLPGASQGLEFLFKPDFSKVTAATILAGVGLAFFKLSVGMGTMITYGSYFRSDQNIPTTAVRVALADMSIALLAGIAIFPAVFAYGFQPDAGPSLLFLTIPSVFASMPAGNVFMVIFFILTFIASVGAQVSLLEVPISLINEKFNLSRKLSTGLATAALFLVGILPALSNSLLANVKIFGLTFFDLFDFATSNIFLPLGGLFICIFVGWVWGKKNFYAALTNNGTLHNEKFVNVIFFLVRFVSPVLVLLVLLNGLGVFS
jgi:NSS family neurotransmitter:Na+ symporter